jgi:hypothetical protein
MRESTLEERILRVLMPEGVELRGEDLWRAVGGGRLFGPDRAAFHASLRRLEDFGMLDCRDAHGGPWRGSSSELIYRLSDGARSASTPGLWTASDDKPLRGPCRPCRKRQTAGQE